MKRFFAIAAISTIILAGVRGETVQIPRDPMAAAPGISIQPMHRSLNDAPVIDFTPGMARWKLA